MKNNNYDTSVQDQNKNTFKVCEASGTRGIIILKIQYSRLESGTRDRDRGDSKEKCQVAEAKYGTLIRHYRKLIKKGEKKAWKDLALEVNSSEQISSSSEDKTLCQIAKTIQQFWNGCKWEVWKAVWSLGLYLDFSLLTNRRGFVFVSPPSTMCTKKETGKQTACHGTQHSSKEDTGNSLTSVKCGQQ